MYRVTKNKYGTWEVWRADRLVRTFWEESEAHVFVAGMQFGEKAAHGESL